MTHANCQCCCDNSFPLIGPTLPTGPFFGYLNATGSLEQGPLAPQRFSGQGFLLYQGAAVLPTAAAEFVARGGQLSFADFKGDVVFAQTAGSAPGNLSFPVSWHANNIGPQPEGATISVQWGPHAASNGGALATGSASFVVSKTLSMGSVSVPLHGFGMPAGTTQTPSLQIYRTRLADDVALATVTDGQVSPVDFCATGVSDGVCRDGPQTLHYYRTPSGIVRESAGGSGQKIRSSLDGRVVVERDGVVVADRLRPTGPQYDTDTAADGSYVVSKYFGREHDNPDKILLWPPRPERVVSSFAKDTTVPKYGFLAPNDHYNDESFASIGVGGLTTSRVFVYAIKPYSRSEPGQLLSHDDESIPGAAIRPSVMTSFSNLPFRMLVAGDGLQRTIGMGGSANDAEYRDSVSGIGPMGLPVVPWRVFPAPTGGKGPRPVLEHPAAMVREQWRPLSPAEQVQAVALTFSEDIAPTGVTADQVQLTADGVAVTGCTIAPVGDGRRKYTIGVPTGPQTEGTFLVLTYDPAGEVVSNATGARPAELAARTSWMMQKPYKRDLKVADGQRVFDIGRTASLCATGPVGPSEESLTVSLTSFAHIAKHDFGTVQHRPRQDLFAPQMPFDATGPTGATGPTDCSYYGMSTTIFPCPPAVLACPMPRSPQPHNAAFRHGRGANGITVTLTGGKFDYFGPLSFVPTRNGHSMPQGTWATTATSSEQVLVRQNGPFFFPNNQSYWIDRIYRDSASLTGTLTAVRAVTEYPALGQAYPWNIELRMTLEVVEQFSVAREVVGSPNPPAIQPPFTLKYGPVSEFYAAVTAAEEKAGTLVRQPREYGFEGLTSLDTDTLAPGFVWLFTRSATTTEMFSWPSPGTPEPPPPGIVSWPLGTVQVDF